MSPELDRLVRDREIARGKAEVAAAKVMDDAYGRAIRNLFRPVAYTRPGYGPGMMLTDSQWQLLDDVENHAAEREARYGRLFPKTFSSVRNLAGRIF